MSDLTRKLGLLDVFCIASGAMVSSGLFVLPGLAHAQAGPAVIFSYFLAGIIATTGMLSVAEIITAMPKAGGDYFFITRTMGPAAGTAAGILSWFSLALKSSFALVGMAAFLTLLLPIDRLLISSGACLFFVLLNVIGIKEASRLQVFLLVGLLTLMILYVVFGVNAVRTELLTPFVPLGWDAVFATTGLVFVSYGGLLKIAAISEEVKNPGKVIPLGMILSLVVIVILYTLMVFITSGVLPAEKLDHSLTPIADGAAIFLGKTGWRIMTVAALLAFITTANAGLMSASRYLLSLSRDGLIPSFLGRVNEKFHTPHVAILVTGALMTASLFLKLEMLVKVASTVLLLTYIFSNLCVIVLRESRLLNYHILSDRSRACINKACSPANPNVLHCPLEHMPTGKDREKAILLLYVNRLMHGFNIGKDIFVCEHDPFRRTRRSRRIDNRCKILSFYLSKPSAKSIRLLFEQPFTQSKNLVIPIQTLPCLC